MRCNKSRKSVPQQSLREEHTAHFRRLAFIFISSITLSHWGLNTIKERRIDKLGVDGCNHSTASARGMHFQSQADGDIFMRLWRNAAQSMRLQEQRCELHYHSTKMQAALKKHNHAHSGIDSHSRRKRTRQSHHHETQRNARERCTR